MNDSYASTIREHMKRAMSEPAGFRPMNRRQKAHFDNLRLFLWSFAGLLAGATAILVYDRLIAGFRP